MVKAAQKPAHDFLLYPCLIQLLMDSNEKRIRQSGKLLRIEKMTAGTVLSMLNYHGIERPADAKFWGAMVNENYICPDGTEVKHDDSDWIWKSLLVNLRGSERLKNM